MNRPNFFYSLTDRQTDRQKYSALRSLRDRTRSRNLMQRCQSSHYDSRIHNQLIFHRYDLATPRSNISRRRGPRHATNDLGWRGATNEGSIKIILVAITKNVNKLNTSSIHIGRFNMVLQNNSKNQNLWLFLRYLVAGSCFWAVEYEFEPGIS